jgi:hypothetical protein
MFPIQSGLKKRDYISPLLSNFALEYAIRTVQEIQVRLTLNMSHQLLICVDDVNPLGKNINTKKKKKERKALIYHSKEVGLEVSIDKAKYMLTSCHRNAGQNYNISKANRSLENVSEFRYLGTTVTNKYLIHEEIKSRLK